MKTAAFGLASWSQDALPDARLGLGRRTAPRPPAAAACLSRSTARRTQAEGPPARRRRRPRRTMNPPRTRRTSADEPGRRQQRRDVQPGLQTQHRSRRRPEPAQRRTAQDQRDRRAGGRRDAAAPRSTKAGSACTTSTGPEVCRAGPADRKRLARERRAWRTAISLRVTPGSLSADKVQRWVPGWRSSSCGRGRHLGASRRRRPPSVRSVAAPWTGCARRAAPPRRSASLSRRRWQVSSSGWRPRFGHLRRRRALHIDWRVAALAWR